MARKRVMNYRELRSDAEKKSKGEEEGTKTKTRM